MEQQFTKVTKAEEDYLTEKVPAYVDELVAKVLSTIAETEVAADADFAAQGIVFEEYSPANGDFLTVSVMEELFHKLHGGDLAVAELMLVMMGKQAGINLLRDELSAQSDR